MNIWIIFLCCYLGLMIGDWLSYLTTRFIPPRGLWKLVPFRVSGWRSVFDDSKVYKIKWVWQKIDFGNYDMEEKK